MPYSCTRLSSRPPFLLRHNGCRPSLSYTDTCRCRTACFNIFKEKQIKLELCHSSVTVPYRNCSSAAATIIPLRHPLQLPFPLYRFMMYIHHKLTVSGRPVFCTTAFRCPGLSIKKRHICGCRTLSSTTKAHCENAEKPLSLPHSAATRRALQASQQLVSLVSSQASQ